MSPVMEKPERVGDHVITIVVDSTDRLLIVGDVSYSSDDAEGQVARLEESHKETSQAVQTLQRQFQGVESDVREFESVTGQKWTEAAATMAKMTEVVEKQGATITDMMSRLKDMENIVSAMFVTFYCSLTFPSVAPIRRFCEHSCAAG